MTNERKKDPSAGRPDLDLTTPQGSARPPRPDEGDQTLMQGHAQGADEAGDTLLHGDSGQDVEKTVELPRPTARTEVAAAAASPAGANANVAGRIFANRFEVVEKLGEGGMGVVYRARDREIEGREIALKVLRPRFSRSAKFRELFFREIHAAQGFVSEHVVQVRDTGKASDGTLFLTMDMVDGEPLDKLLERENSLNERHALEIARQTLVALSSGHEQGFVHRDIKPSNVMLARRVAKTDDNPFGVGVRLLDFGVAGLAAQMEEGQIIGTPRYMSPEQVQGQRLDGRSDLFSVGILLYEMLSGSRPFDGKTPEECHTAILETNITPLITELQNLSEPIRKILTKALQKNRDKRFQSASDFVQAIEKSRAFREKKGMPAWASSLMFLSILGAGSLGWMVWDKTKEVGELQGRLGTIEGIHAQQLQERDRANKQEVADLTEKLTAANLAKEAAISAKNDAEGARKAAGDLLSKEARDAQEKANEIRDLRLRVSQLEEERKNSRPDVVAARFFDDVTKRIDAGYPQDAYAYLNARKGAGNVDIPEGEGGTHLQQVLEAAAALDAAAKILLVEGNNGDTVALEPAARSAAFSDYQRGMNRLEQAEASAASFQLEAEKWITTKASLDEAEPADRLAELAHIRSDLAAKGAKLKERIEALRRDLDDMVGKERADLMKIGFRADPTPVIQHMRSYFADADKLTPLLDRLGAETESHCAPGNRLDLQRVVKLETIGKWGEFLTGDGAKCKGKGADTFRWLWAASLFYGGDNLQGERFAFVAPRPQVNGDAPHAEWRALLAMQREFAERIEHYLKDSQGAAVFRQHNLTNNSFDWYYERLESDKATNDRGTIERVRIDATGKRGTPQTIDVAMRRGALLIADMPTLDVRAQGEEVQVAFWKPTIVAPLPSQPWAQGMRHELFQKKLENGLPCVVIESGKTKYWFSPGFGMVRMEVADVFVREVCFSARGN